MAVGSQAEHSQNDNYFHSKWSYVVMLHNDGQGSNGINLVTGLKHFNWKLKKLTKWQLFSLKMTIFPNLTIFIENIYLLSMEQKIFLSHLEIKRKKNGDSIETKSPVTILIWILDSQYVVNPPLCVDGKLLSFFNLLSFASSYFFLSLK